MLLSRQIPLITTITPQGRFLAIILHSLFAVMMALATESEYLGAHLGSAGCVAVSGHIRVIWEANCSCGASGYPEGSMQGLRTALKSDGAFYGSPSPMDAPTESQAAARESATLVLRALRHMAGLVWPDHPAVAAASSCSNGIDPASYADWEMLQSELLELPSLPQPEGLPAASSSGCSWGEALWCFNPACTNLEGPSELALKTFACGGSCGVRYCSPECQAQGWRDGHRLSCGRLRDRRAARVRSGEQ